MPVTGRLLIGLMTASLLIAAGGVSLSEGQTTLGGAMLGLGVLRGAFAVYQWRKWKDE